VHNELRLLVKAGFAPVDALRADTADAAGCLGAAGRAGQLREGGDASLILVEGNPLEDIASTERIVNVFFHGERVDRGALVAREK
jgi:imidazolonepropionase-like amidohydrolase